MITVVAATRNKHKIKEIDEITGKFGMHIISRDDAGVPPVEIPETGTTFEENSYIKAFEIMKRCGQMQRDGFLSADSVADIICRPVN